jgi:hypothetical protein
MPRIVPLDRGKVAITSIEWPTFMAPQTLIPTMLITLDQGESIFQYQFDEFQKSKNMTP